MFVFLCMFLVYRCFEWFCLCFVFLKSQFVYFSWLIDIYLLFFISLLWIEQYMNKKKSYLFDLPLQIHPFYNSWKFHSSPSQNQKESRFSPILSNSNISCFHSSSPLFLAWLCYVSSHYYQRHNSNRAYLFQTRFYKSMLLFSNVSFKMTYSLLILFPRYSLTKST